ncbi:serine/threonine-protein kinase [Rivularia sp. UHCC 0363]|uniref:serine/threonine-protein kinase n=1 Tax=Rivularia sp. UHCC 0363 TaxID=3110244 RepID=UPI002B215538|nr:serine/threonine-protein kinase [Rivularia sp. UHCC 0363]MEA5596451.1 serine/threonine-protein kinase [Rivularia sp. UHCC 0363]
MSYCLNPNCLNPENLPFSERCQSCGARIMLRDRYRVTKSLGQGGFGATFLAQDEALPGEPSCVIKQLRPSGTAPHVLQMARELFEREATTLGKIGNHPQVPRLLDYFEDHEHFYLIQEYVHGSTIQQEVKHNGVLGELGVKQFLSEILPLLQYIHSQKVIHRDIKPANLIRRAQDSRLVMIDFGAVKNQVSQTAAMQSGQTALTAYAIGTPGFAPPEQMAMRPVYSSDIYALGITCIYLLTGKSPKDLEYNPATGEVMWQHLVHVSDHFAQVLAKMMDVSVRNRYQSADEVLRAMEMEPYLDSLTSGLSAPSNPVSSQKTSTGFGDSNTNANNSSTSFSSAGVAQVAAAIRARKAKAASGNAFRMGTANNRVLTSRAAASTSDSTKSSVYKSNPDRRLSSESLLTAYLKGRRDFASHNLSLLNLQGSDLSETNFHSSKLEKANLQGTNLYNSDFGRANLNKANLRDANLSKAYFNHADLELADLRGADLSYAHLSNANLRGTNLCGANLTGAKISPEELALAKTNWMTIRPNGRRGLL